tara:strand:+ start:1811 stop:1999 length:189 start_codon:yes stop_codon:yes gene_type:complete
MSRQKNDNPITLSELSQPLEYAEANTENEFEIDWDAVHGLDQWTRKLISQGKTEPPMKRKNG